MDGVLRGSLGGVLLGEESRERLRGLSPWSSFGFVSLGALRLLGFGVRCFSG